MISYDSLWLFLAASVGVTIAPGPDNIFVLTQGMNYNRKLALLAAWGMVSGVTVHTIAAAFGVSAVLKSEPIMFLILKMAGAGYLFYLAIKSLRGLGTNIKLGEGDHDRTPSASEMFRRGFLMNVLNPKVALFFLAFLPQFVSKTGTNEGIQILIFGCLFMLQAWILFSALALFSAQIGQLLRRRQSISSGITILSSFIFVALGIKLVFEQI